MPRDILLPSGQGFVHGLAGGQVTFRLAGTVIDGLALTVIGGADFQFIQTAEHIQLGDGQPVSPLRRTALFKITVSSQPQRAPAAGGRAKFGAGLLEWSPISSNNSDGERTRPHAGGVGLDDPDHAIDGPGSDAAAAAGIAGNGIGGGHKRVSAVIDVQMGALGAFKQDLFTGAPAFCQNHGNVGDVWLQSLAYWVY
jgi:hypothetical protein